MHREDLLPIVPNLRSPTVPQKAPILSSLPTLAYTNTRSSHDEKVSTNVSVAFFCVFPECAQTPSAARTPMNMGMERLNYQQEVHQSMEPPRFMRCRDHFLELSLKALLLSSLPHSARQETCHARMPLLSTFRTTSRRIKTPLFGGLPPFR